MHNSATSPDQASASTADTRDNPSARTMTPIRETSMSTPSVLPPDAASFQGNADLLAHSGTPEILSLASLEPVLDHVFPTGIPPALTLPFPNLTNRRTQNFIPQERLERLRERLLHGQPLHLSPLPVMRVAPRLVRASIKMLLTSLRWAARSLLAFYLPHHCHRLVLTWRSWVLRGGN